MRLTKFTDYSLRVLMYMGSKPGNELITIAELADAYSISINHVRMVVHKLVQNGFVKSTHGKGGGLILSMRPNKLNIGDIVRKSESDFDVVECFNPEGSCPINRVCKLQHILDDALNAFLAVLDNYTLEDLTKNKVTIMKHINMG